VRDQLSLADGRLLRRRSVRAHLRTCDGCREYAVSVRRRAGQPVHALPAWSPLAGYQLLESVFRAAASSPAAVQGGSSLFGPLAVKAATLGALVATGVSAADVATMQPERSRATAAAAAPRAVRPKRLATAGSSALRAVKPRPAVFRTTTVSLAAAQRTTSAYPGQDATPGRAISPHAAARASQERPSSSRPAARNEPGNEPSRQERAPTAGTAPASAPARAQADCNTTAAGGGQQQQATSEQPPTRQVAPSGDPQGQPSPVERGSAGAR
jgi:hypothetical protein